MKVLYITGSILGILLVWETANNLNAYIMQIIYFTIASFFILLAGYDSVSKIKEYSNKNEQKKLKNERYVFLVLVFLFMSAFFMLLW